MAIDAYTGNPRSGKSYSVVKNVIIPSLREGRHVYTNIPMTDKAHSEFPGHIHQLDKDWFSSPDLADLFPAGSVVVLDELWRRWPSGMKVNAFPFKDKEFLAEHGHNVDENGNTTRVVLVTQDLADIASFARGKVDKTYRSQKLDAVGADNRFRVDIYEGCVTGQKPPKTQFIRSIYDKYEPEYYVYYMSSTKSQTGDVGNEKRADKRANIWRSPLIIFSIVGPLTLGPLLLWWLYGYFMSGFGMVEKVESELPDTLPAESLALVNPPPPSLASFASPSPSASSVQQPPAKPSNSSVWRVAGYIARGQGKGTERSAWPSYTGYGSIQADISQADPLPDLVVLQSDIYGLRYELASSCELLPDRKSHMCHIDGAIVTPWTGRGDSTQWASDPVRLAGRTASVASVATERSGTAGPNANPQPPTAERL